MEENVGEVQSTKKHTKFFVGSFQTGKNGKILEKRVCEFILCLFSIDK